jgi:hypothetical protein
VIIALDHVQLSAPAGSEDVLRRFCLDALNMTELPKPPVLAARGGCWFAVGPVQLHYGIEQDFRPARKAHPALRVADIDAVADRLTTHGTPVVWDTDLPGFRRFHADDPVGNRMEFLEPR